MTGILSAENWIGNLPAHVREAIDSRTTILEVPAGTTIKSAGDAPEAMFQVESGYIRLLGLHRDGRQILILIYSAGNVFGETPMVAHRPFTHTTVALTDVRIRRIAMSDFWDLYHTHPEIPEALCRKFAHNITKGFMRREMSATHRLYGQIAAMFVNIGEYCGVPEPGGGVSFSLPITQSDIAEHLEVTRQAVQREIGAMKDAGLIEKRNGSWHIASLNALRQCGGPDPALRPN